MSVYASENGTDSLSSSFSNLTTKGLSAAAVEWQPTFGMEEEAGASQNGTPAAAPGGQTFDELQSMLQQLAAGSAPQALKTAAAEADQDEANLQEIEAALAQEEINTFLDEQGP